MPACWTRSTAARATLSMSTSFCSSSCRSASSASGTGTRRLRVRPWNRPGSMSLTLMSTSSTDDPAMISNDGNDCSRTSISTLLVIQPSLAELLAQLLARPLRLLADRRRALVELRGGRQRRQQQVEHALLGRHLRLLAHLRGPLLADELHRDLGQIADHRLDVAPDVADFGELRRLDLEERRLRQLRQPPRDLGLADAGRADHQDVLRRDLLRHLGGQLLPPHPVAQRDRDGALRLVLADDVLVELGDDLPRRHATGSWRWCFPADRWAWRRAYRTSIVSESLE